MKTYTIFYSLETGEIYSWIQSDGGKSGFNIFGKFSEDFKKILGVLYIESDDSLKSNLKNMWYDPEKGKLVQKDIDTAYTIVEE